MLPKSVQRGFMMPMKHASMGKDNRKSCARCHRICTFLGDWFDALCPLCADDAEVEWVRPNCSNPRDFEAMNASGTQNPIYCGSP
jgi:hypothetical protein